MYCVRVDVDVAIVKVFLTFTSLEFDTALTTILPILFQCCYRYCYNDSQNL